MNRSESSTRPATRRDRPRSKVPTSGDGAPASDGDDTGRAAYDDLFGPPALVTLSDEEVYRRVRRFARQRPTVVRRASQAGRREFWESGSPFDYDVTADEAGGQGR